MRQKILISACLSGQCCAYDGKSRLLSCVSLLKERFDLIPVCPELLGGFCSPREKHEIRGGTGADVLSGKASVVSETGADHTDQFLEGAKRTLEIAVTHNVCAALLKAKSPSCGFGQIYSGYFNAQMIPGNGVAAELLSRNGVKIFTEKDDFKKHILQ
ncbi:MAG TPA: DUF523 domain-containing protein [Candidatus Omnitrophota bacterium]|nr:DUF523 domain-containing protein [Candidatus Omnitrophota bacterium]HPS20832.1 DUF523 domain-containing protein [Candidatus Omnitrophota bacterium]